MDRLFFAWQLSHFRPTSHIISDQERPCKLFARRFASNLSPRVYVPVSTAETRSGRTSTPSPPQAREKQTRPSRCTECPRFAVLFNYCNQRRLIDFADNFSRYFDLSCEALRHYGNYSWHYGNCQYRHFGITPLGDPTANPGVSESQ